MNVRFCPSCRSLILADFRFCPYCGAPAFDGPGIATALDRPFAALEGAQAPLGAARAARGQAFAEAEEMLDRLESDMDLILEELGKEGRSAP